MIDTVKLDNMFFFLNYLTRTEHSEQNQNVLIRIWSKFIKQAEILSEMKSVLFCLIF
jgi:hypothetical protein